MTGPVTFGQKMGIGRVSLPVAESHHALPFLGRQRVRERQLIAEQPHGHAPRRSPDASSCDGVDGDRAPFCGE
ncbi:hypothetical protein ACH41H_11660 [Streptomyces sp. NPDC020800]|uniref:hypothetical protein n=1 Tax=Streptomyces sp. NPDC020800 TaxID=3365092 RepID=UPI0037AE8EB2